MTDALSCQINAPHLLIFRYFSDLIRTTPRVLILRILTFFANSSCHSLSLLVLFMPNLYDKTGYCCIYFSSLLYDNLLLFFPSLHNHLQPFLKFQSPVYWISEFFPTPCLLGPPVYMAPESKWLRLGVYLLIGIKCPYLIGTLYNWPKWKFYIKV